MRPILRISTIHIPRQFLPRHRERKKNSLLSTSPISQPLRFPTNINHASLKTQLALLNLRYTKFKSHALIGPVKKYILLVL